MSEAFTRVGERVDRFGRDGTAQALSGHPLDAGPHWAGGEREGPGQLSGFAQEPQLSTTLRVTTSTDSNRPKRRRARSRSNGKLIPLAKRSSSHFRPATRDRGTEHFEAGRVQFEVDGQRARALVEAVDEQAFLVGIDWERVPEKRALHTFCNCPDFAGGEKCEHVWAALLAIGEESPESQPTGADRLSVRRDRPDRWVDLGPSVQDAASAPAPHRATPRARGTRSGGVASWRSQLAALRDDFDVPTVATAKAPARRTSRSCADAPRKSAASYCRSPWI